MSASGHNIGGIPIVELREITSHNLPDVLGLNVADAQEEFVASNIYTLAEAYVALTNGEFEPMPYAIYAGDDIVGLIGMAYLPVGSPSNSGRTQGSYEIYRFMIDERFQGKGHGRAALQLAVNLLRTQPRGPATQIETGFVPGNEVARRLYTSLGFVETGEEDEDGELIAVLAL